LPHLELWNAIYEHLLRVEDHWTTQLQNQQQRNASILTVNGIVLGFLGFGSFSAAVSHWSRTPTLLLLSGLAPCGISLVAGLLCMLPRVRIGASNG
jgi:hypothetical protein